MSLYSLPYTLECILEKSEVARPDGGVPIAIDGRDLLARAGGSGHLDFDSIRVEQPGVTLRDTPVQFVPDADFDPVDRPCGTLWIRLYKQTWEDRDFPRRYRVCFDRMRDGGKKPWRRDEGADQPGSSHTLSARPRSVEIRGADGRLALGFDFPPGRKPGLHPLTTPAGLTVTETMPRDHAWHRGVWFGWTDVTCDGLGVPRNCCWIEPCSAAVRDLGLTRLVSGPVVCGFTSGALWSTPTGDPLMRGTMKVEYQSVDAGWCWTDLTLTLEAVRPGVTLHTDYGHLTARAAIDLRDSYMLDSTSDGKPLTVTSRQEIDQRWAGFSGVKPDGRPVSLVMLDHPANPGARPWRDYFYEIRNFPIEAGTLFIAMSINPLRKRPMTLTPGAPVTWRYRVVTSDRPLTADFGEYQYGNWSTPWQVSWRASNA